MAKPFNTREEAYTHLRAMGYDRPRIHPTATIENTTFVDIATITIKQYAVIGSAGFGYDPETKLRWKHTGGVVIGKNVDIGANTCIDRGNLTNTIIRDDTKIDNLVHIAHGAVIGEGCLIVAGSVIGGSAVIGDNCFIGMNASIKDHVKIGDNAKIGAGAVVVKDIPSGDKWWIGCPAKPMK